MREQASSCLRLIRNIATECGTYLVDLLFVSNERNYRIGLFIQLFLELLYP